MGKHRGQMLRGPGDVRRAIQRIQNNIFKEGSEVENAGKLAQLYNVFLKAYDIEKVKEEVDQLKEKVDRIEKRDEMKEREKYC